MVFFFFLDLGWLVGVLFPETPVAGPRGRHSLGSVLQAPLAPEPGGGSRGRAAQGPPAGGGSSSFPVKTVRPQRGRAGIGGPDSSCHRRRYRSNSRAAMTSHPGSGARRKWGGRGRVRPGRPRAAAERHERGWTRVPRPERGVPAAQRQEAGGAGDRVPHSAHHQG